MAEFIPIGRLRQPGRFSVRDQPANCRSVRIMLISPSADLGCGVNGFSMSDDSALKMLAPFGSLAA
jgi:hypothetical protein